MFTVVLESNLYIGLESGSDQHDVLSQALQPGQQAEARSVILCGKQRPNAAEHAVVCKSDHLLLSYRFGLWERSA